MIFIILIKYYLLFITYFCTILPSIFNLYPATKPLNNNFIQMDDISYILTYIYNLIIEIY